MIKICDDVMSRREDAARQLGLNPNTIAWPNDHDDTYLPVDDRILPSERRIETNRLVDSEWVVLSATGLLPSEPTQAGSMDNRSFIDAVLAVVGQGRAWTELDAKFVSSEAVRKKFARLSKVGFWQALGDAADNLALTSDRRREFKLIAVRADAICRN